MNKTRRRVYNNALEGLRASLRVVTKSRLRNWRFLFENKQLSDGDGSSQSSNHIQYIIQGSDFKARLWMKKFGENVHYFDSVRELTSYLRRPGCKRVIFRYMNSSARFLGDLSYTAYILALCAAHRLIGAELFFILHNIDKETIDRYPLLTWLRRAGLRIASKKVFVTDKLFKQLFFMNDRKAEYISFGPKLSGAIAGESVNKLSKLSASCDQVALCMGATGPKYAHFKEVHNLQSVAKAHGIHLGIAVPLGADISGTDIIYLSDINIDESQLSEYVDFIYRSNNDISMPYTVYAACSAKIPIVSNPRYFTYQIIKTYGIGFSEEDWFTSSDEQRALVQKRMGEFLEGTSWNTLYERLTAIDDQLAPAIPKGPRLGE